MTAYRFQTCAHSHCVEPAEPGSTLCAGHGPAVGGRRFVRRNRWDNWYGYLGRKRVRMFGNSPEETAEQAAERWLAGDNSAGIPA